ncbi:unnamed protein product [Sphagnum jensenii]|uniref:Uncharacterized protein n=1 Tax=Sphagnum jensenii TaxID=128206 RepID=A0ABP1BU95_9BRYO
MQLEARSCKSSSLAQNFTNVGQTTTHISISTDTIVKQTTLATYLPIMKMPCCNFGTTPSILRCLSRKCCSSFGTISSILRSMSRNCCNFGTSSQLYSEIHEQMMLLQLWEFFKLF